MKGKESMSSITQTCVARTSKAQYCIAKQQPFQKAKEDLLKFG